MALPKSVVGSGRGLVGGSVDLALDLDMNFMTAKGGRERGDQAARKGCLVSRGDGE